MADPEIGGIYADSRLPGRWVQVLSIRGAVVEAETVKAADAALSARAVGRQTHIDKFNFRTHFTAVSADEIARELPSKSG